MELEAAQLVVVLRERPLTLEDLDEHRRLVIRRSRERLALARRDECVARDEGRHHPARRLDPESKRVNVEERDRVVHRISGENRALYRCAVRNRLIGIYATRRFLSEKLPQELLDFWDTRGPADEHNLSLGTIQ